MCRLGWLQLTAVLQMLKLHHASREWTAGGLLLKKQSIFDGEGFEIRRWEGDPGDENSCVNPNGSLSSHLTVFMLCHPLWVTSVEVN